MHQNYKYIKIPKLFYSGEVAFAVLRTIMWDLDMAEINFKKICCRDISVELHSHHRNWISDLSQMGNNIRCDASFMPINIFYKIYHWWSYIFNFCYFSNIIIYSIFIILLWRPNVDWYSYDTDDCYKGLYLNFIRFLLFRFWDNDWWINWWINSWINEMRKFSRNRE